MKKRILFAISIGLAVLLASCSKTTAPKPVLSSAKTVAGTYKGFTISNNLKSSGVVTVDSVNDSMVSIHCYDSLGFDTTFVMQMFENGDSIMLCSNGQYFYN